MMDVTACEERLDLQVMAAHAGNGSSSPLGVSK